MNKSFLAGGILALLLASCSSDEPAKGTDNNEPDTPIEEEVISRTDEELLNSQTAFSFNLFKVLDSQRLTTDENVAVAPYTISTVLSILANGVGDAHADQLMSVLGSNRHEIEQFNRLNSEIREKLPTLDPSVELIISNSLWGPSNDFFTDAYSELTKKYYNTELFEANLKSREGLEAFNSWCAKATKGKIKQAFQVDPMPAIIGRHLFASVNYFDGKWEKPFETEEYNGVPVTSVFCTASNDWQQGVVYMSNSGSYYIYRDADFEAIRLPYGNGNFRMTILAGKSTNAELIGLLTPERWAKVQTEGSIVSSCRVTIPRFKVTSGTDSNDSGSADVRKAMKNMGVDLFDEYNEQPFSGVQSGKVYLGGLKHTVIIETNENGTVAVGSTAGGIRPSGGNMFSVSRRFVFVIDDATTGTILFMGAVNHID